MWEVLLIDSAKKMRHKINYQPWDKMFYRFSKAWIIHGFYIHKNIRFYRYSRSVGYSFINRALYCFVKKN